MRIRPIVYAVPALLAVPAFATLISDQFNWGLGDFLIMGVLLLIVLGLIDWVWHKFPGKALRSGLIVLILLAFLLVWAELAVGIFGTPFAGN